MIKLSVEELLTLNALKTQAEALVRFERSEPYYFTMQDYLILKKLLEGFHSSNIKIRLRAPKVARKPSPQP